jgi:hypothetical protein
MLVDKRYDPGVACEAALKGLYYALECAHVHFGLGSSGNVQWKQSTPCMGGGVGGSRRSQHSIAHACG